MIIDALDTMHSMGLASKYEHARRWITDSLSFDRSGLLNAFEVTIRVWVDSYPHIASHLTPDFGQGRRPSTADHIANF